MAGVPLFQGTLALNLASTCALQTIIEACSRSQLACCSFSTMKRHALLRAPMRCCCWKAGVRISPLDHTLLDGRNEYRKPLGTIHLCSGPERSIRTHGCWTLHWRDACLDKGFARDARKKRVRACLRESDGRSVDLGISKRIRDKQCEPASASGTLSCFMTG